MSSRKIITEQNDKPWIPTKVLEHKRIAIYTRTCVPTDGPNNAQLDILMQKYPEMKVVRVYEDIGLDYLAFQELVSDANNRMFDLVIMRDISRLARNILTAIGRVSDLQAANVDVCFEENKMFLQADDKMLLNILTVVADEESKAKSESAKRGWETRRKKYNPGHSGFRAPRL